MKKKKTLVFLPLSKGRYGHRMRGYQSLLSMALALSLAFSAVTPALAASTDTSLEAAALPDSKTEDTVISDTDVILDDEITVEVIGDDDAAVTDDDTASDESEADAEAGTDGTVTPENAELSDFSIDKYGRITSYSGKSANVIIPDKINGKDVKILGARVFKDKDEVRTVMFNSPNLTTVESGAFENTTNLENVIFPSSLTTIGDEVFKGSGVKYVVLPTSLTTIGRRAFQDCLSLENITIPANVLSLGDYIFSNCSSLSDVIMLTPLNQQGASIGEGVFKGCEIKNISLSKDMTSIPKGLFKDAGFAASAVIEIPSTVTTINEGAFQRATGLTKVNFTNSKLTTIGDLAFAETGIVSIHLPESLTGIGTEAFLDCNELKDISIPSKVTKLGDKAFWGCEKLDTVTLNTNVLSSIGSGIFTDCSIETLVLPGNMTAIPSRLFYEAGFNGDFTLNIPQGVTNIGDEAFYKATGITGIFFYGNSLTSIGNKAFYGVGLKDINFPLSLNAIGASAFENCDELTSLVLTSGITSIGGGAFKGCSRLDEVIINSTKLTSLGTNVFPDGVISNVTFGDDFTVIPQSLFEGINFASNLTVNIPAKVTSIGDNAFKNVSTLTSVVFMGDKLTSIGKGAFSGTGLTAVNLPASLTTLGSRAFENCSDLTSITIPNKIKKLPEGVFAGCTSLDSIFIPASVTAIESSAFEGCPRTAVFFTEKSSFAEKWVKERNLTQKVSLPIIYNTNGGVNSEENPRYFIVDEEIDEIKPATRKGYRFDGWYTDKNFSTPFFTVSGQDKVLTLFAKWTILSYTIKYDTDGGTNPKENRTTYSITTKMTLKPAVKRGYVFAGWYSDPGFSSTKMVSSINGNLAQDLELYARFKPVKYSIAYNGNGSENIYNGLSVGEYGEKIYIEDGNIFNRPGYEFIGWNTAKTGKGTWIKSKDDTGYYVQNLTEKNAARVILYAQWKIITFEVDYVLGDDEDGGLYPAVNPLQNPMEHTASKPIGLKNPTRPGFNFKGWHLDPDMTQLVKQVPAVGEDVTLYAKWEPYTYTVSFNANGGKVKEYSNAPSAIKGIEFNAEPYFLDPDIYEVYERYGYEFDGWNTSKKGVQDEKGIIVEAGGSFSGLSTKKNGKVTLFAQWNPIEYTIYYENMDNAYYDSKTNPDTYTVVKPWSLVKPKRSDAKFKGFYADPNFTQKVTKLNASVMKNYAEENNTLTLYALWD